MYVCNIARYLFIYLLLLLVIRAAPNDITNTISLNLLKNSKDIKYNYNGHSFSQKDKHLNRIDLMSTTIISKTITYAS
jgi:hypothetical protein